MFAGNGLTGGGSSGRLTLEVGVENGLTAATDAIRLGGPLSQSTVIDLPGTNTLRFNLTGTADLVYSTSGSIGFRFNDSGVFQYGGPVIWYESQVNGSRIAELGGNSGAGEFTLRGSTDRRTVDLTSSNDQGRLVLYGLNDSIDTDLDALNGYVFNQQGDAVDFRVEGDTDASLLRTNGATDSVGIGGFNAASKLTVRESGGRTLLLERTSSVSTAGDLLGALGFTFAEGTALNDLLDASALITSAADGNLSNSNKGAWLSFWTSPAGSPKTASAVERVRIGSQGEAIFGEDVILRNGSVGGTPLIEMGALNGDGLMTLFDSGSTTIQVDGGSNRIRLFNDNGALVVNLDAINATVFNEASLPLDFRVESGTEPNMFFIDGDQDRVGIGTIFPDARLEVQTPTGNSLLLNRDDATVVNDEILGAIGFDARDGGNFSAMTRAPVAIVARASESFSSADKGAALEFRTSNLNSDKNTETPVRMVIGASGTTTFTGDALWRDGGTSATTIFEIRDDDNDGQLRILENGAIAILLDGNSDTVFNENSTTKGFRVESNGNSNMLNVNGLGNRVGIGRVATGFTLEVQGSAAKTTAGNWLLISDRRVKQNVETIGSALDTLNRVRLVSYAHTPGYFEQYPEVPDKRYFNVVAQEYAEVFPESVFESGDVLEDGERILNVDTHPLTIYSAAAIQELDDKVEAEVSALRAENAELHAALAEMAQRLEALENR